MIELRNYLLKPGFREPFIRYFENHFIHPQERLGGNVLGQFRVRHEEERFFWIRGFGNMAQRSAFLPAFYTGSAWKQYGPAANDMMLEWHHVHLLKPYNNSGVVNSNTFSFRDKLVVAEFYMAKEGQLHELLTAIKDEYLPFIYSVSENEPSLWLTEAGENDFPRLPVVQQDNLVVLLSAYSDETAYRQVLSAATTALAGYLYRLKALVQYKKPVLLHPTPRSA